VNIRFEESALNELFTPPFGKPGPIFDKGEDRPSALAVGRIRRRHSQFGRHARPATDRLFWAALPDSETAAKVADFARRRRRELGLTGRPLDARHLHVTLCHVADALGPPPSELVEIVSRRAANVVMPPFRVVFDRVMSFRNGALVLRGGDGVIGLEILQQRLSDVLDGRPRQARPFTPHVTLLRDSRRIDEHPVEPIGWTVREFVLVHSLLGQTTHRHLVRVPLA
jgi:2'-5' RNA ligase